MPITVSKLREDIFHLLDEVLQTGKPLEIERKGKHLKIVPAEPIGKLKNLQKRSLIKGGAEGIVHLDWSKEWKPKIK